MNVKDEIKALKERIAELEEQEQKEQEFPQNYDDYWYIDTTGDIYYENWHGFSFEKAMLEIGNVFRTKEQVEFVVEKLKVEAELRKFSRQFVWGKENWYLGMDNDKDIFLEYDNYEMYHGVTYFESKNKVKEAIEAVGEERIKKYIFGVKSNGRRPHPICPL